MEAITDLKISLVFLLYNKNLNHPNIINIIDIISQILISLIEQILTTSWDIDKSRHTEYKTEQWRVTLTTVQPARQAKTTR